MVKGFVINRWGQGIRLNGTGATDIKVTGNYIGTDVSGTQGLGNTSYGMFIDYALNNTIGGTTAAESNVISGNNGNGVFILDATATGNRLLSNSIYANDLQGIELSGAGANDPGDADTGPNDLQNFPVLTSATTSTSSTTLRGALNSTPSKTFQIQFFSNPAGTDEGETLIGETSVTTNANGDASFEFVTSNPTAVGQNITATATGSATGNTSEFSAPVSVDAATNTNPSISSLKPAPGSTTRDRTPTIGAKVTDAETNLAKSNIRLYVDGNRKDFSYDRFTDGLSFTPGTGLSFAKHTVKIVATDASGAVGTKSWSFTVTR